MACLLGRHDAASGSAPTTPVTKSTEMFKHLLSNKPKTTQSRANPQTTRGKAGVNPTFERSRRKTLARRYPMVKVNLIEGTKDVEEVETVRQDAQGKVRWDQEEE
jgi:hypothetical protein